MSDIKKIHTANACPRTFQLIAEMRKERLLTEIQLLDPTYVSSIIPIPIAPEQPR